jgi:hypothetical protein
MRKWRLTEIEKHAQSHREKVVELGLLPYSPGKLLTSRPVFLKLEYTLESPAGIYKTLGVEHRI